MIKNILYLFRFTQTPIRRVFWGEFIHGMLLAIPMGMLLTVIWELFETSPNVPYLCVIIAIMCGSFILQMWLAGKIYTYTNKTVYSMTCQLRLRLGDQLQKLSLGYYKKRDPGDLASIILQDVTNVETILGHALPNIFGAVFGTLFLALFLLWTDVLLAVVLLAAIPLALLLAHGGTLLIKKLGQSQIKSRNETGSRFIEYILGIRHLKAYNQTGNRFKTLQKAFHDLRNNSIKMEAVPGPIILMAFVIFELFFLFMIYLGLGRISNLSITTPAMVAFLILGYRLYEPLKLLMVDYAVMTYMNVSLLRIMDLLNTPLQGSGKALLPQSYDIRFNRVTFSYLDRVILKEVNFSIPHQSITALVGASGSGKTTIANLIARFWDIEQGSISIGNVDIRDISTDNIYNMISEVFQDVYLFDDSIYHNILIGKPSASEDEVMKVIHQAQVSEFLDQLPDGLNTKVGEGGSNLSGGQKQRISIARAMLKNAPIVLLDEATASLDPENEIYIQQAIQGLVRDKTVVVIAHKLQTIRNADQIIVLEDGNVKECGNHRQLMEDDGLYASYWRIQQRKTSWKLAV